MRQSLLLLFAFVALSLPQAQNKITEIEIGVIEHLGDTIPLDLKFLNENNDSVSLRELVDKPTIFTFVYFDCPGACSPLLAGVSDAVSNLDMVLGKDYQIITISFNTKDTPEKAREKKENFVQKFSKEDREAWHYLTGTQQNINTITDAIGFKYKPEGFDFAHPSVITVVSPQGKITRYLYGLTFLPFDVKMAIIEGQQGIARPSINKILEICFAYNPESRSYSLQVTRIMGVMIIVVAAIVLLILFFAGRKKKKQ